MNGVPSECRDQSMTTDEGTPSVLVVEDQESIATAYEAALERTYHVQRAANGREALDRIDDAVDVVLLDRRMPGLSGDDVLRELHERECSPSVAMVTAVEPDGEILDMPFDEYATKPLQVVELEELVEVLLARDTDDGEYRRLFRLLVKQTVLENTNKQWTDAYRAVSAELEELQRRLDDPDDELLPGRCLFH